MKVHSPSLNPFLTIVNVSFLLLVSSKTLHPSNKLSFPFFLTKTPLFIVVYETLLIKLILLSVIVLPTNDCILPNTMSTASSPRKETTTPVPLPTHLNFEVVHSAYHKRISFSLTRIEFWGCCNSDRSSTTIRPVNGIFQSGLSFVQHPNKKPSKRPSK